MRWGWGAEAHILRTWFPIATGIPRTTFIVIAIAHFEMGPWTAKGGRQLSTEDCKLPEAPNVTLFHACALPVSNPHLLNEGETQMNEWERDLAEGSEQGSTSQTALHALPQGHGQRAGAGRRPGTLWTQCRARTTMGPWGRGGR